MAGQEGPFQTGKQAWGGQGSGWGRTAGALCLSQVGHVRPPGVQLYPGSSGRLEVGPRSPIFLICLFLGKQEIVGSLKNLLDISTTKKEVFLNAGTECSAQRPAIVRLSPPGAQTVVATVWLVAAFSPWGL